MKHIQYAMVICAALAFSTTYSYAQTPQSGNQGQAVAPAPSAAQPSSPSGQTPLTDSQGQPVTPAPPAVVPPSPNPNRIQGKTAGGESQMTIIDEGGNLKIVEKPKQNAESGGQSAPQTTSPGMRETAPTTPQAAPTAPQAAPTTPQAAPTTPQAAPTTPQADQ